MNHFMVNRAVERKNQILRHWLRMTSERMFFFSVVLSASEGSAFRAEKKQILRLRLRMALSEQKIAFRTSCPSW
jgi:hypothetical protein